MEKSDLKIKSAKDSEAGIGWVPKEADF